MQQLSTNISNSSLSKKETTMVNSPRIHETQTQSPKPTQSSITTSNGSIPITISEPNNPYPSTFVQADTSSFKQVVQMLTGSTQTRQPTRNPIPPMKTGPRKDKSGSKLYERRNSFKNFHISPLGSGFVNSGPGYRTGSPREILSPSILDFPSLVLSPITPLISDPFNRGGVNGNSELDLVAEEKAIQEKGFYLHPKSPMGSEPRLLPLFPLTSPRSGEKDESASATSNFLSE